VPLGFSQPTTVRNASTFKLPDVGLLESFQLRRSYALSSQRPIALLPLRAEPGQRGLCTKCERGAPLALGEHHQKHRPTRSESRVLGVSPRASGRDFSADNLRAAPTEAGIPGIRNLR
jgi:hypothetical protein